jgi:hypothetical protein
MEVSVVKAPEAGVASFVSLVSCRRSVWSVTSILNSSAIRMRVLYYTCELLIEVAYLTSCARRMGAVRVNLLHVYGPLLHISLRLLQA